MSVTDDRQTDGLQHIANVNVSSHWLKWCKNICAFLRYRDCHVGTFYYASPWIFSKAQTVAEKSRDAFLFIIATEIVLASFFSDRELTFTFAICYRPSVCRL